ncbi:hypothetical protein EV424DRAFT_1428006 [Suillus variegatus]|nr:hypothetical protein EV424DRAFT_1430589 [Suillus variegatus]KAG1807212.1 hypothetical protein EV424DRAFT_1428006 [Suillus variegatus]
MLLPPPDDITFLHTINKIYLQSFKFPEALDVAIRLNDTTLIRRDFNASVLLFCDIDSETLS